MVNSKTYFLIKKCIIPFVAACFLDDEHLSVSNDELISTTVTQYEEAIIPCRPTAPSVNVTLVSDDNPRIKVSYW